MNKETDIYLALSKYMSLKYPKMLFRFDYGAGLKMDKYQYQIQKALNPHRGYPDFFLAFPANGYAGLFLEIKRQSPFKIDGITPLKVQHLIEQFDMLARLNAIGFKATIGVGIDGCINQIEKYLK